MSPAPCYKIEAEERTERTKQTYMYNIVMSNRPKINILYFSCTLGLPFRHNSFIKTYNLMFEETSQVEVYMNREREAGQKAQKAKG